LSPLTGSEITVFLDTSFGAWNGYFWNTRQFGFTGVGKDAINAPELARLFIEKPAILLGRFDNAAGEKRTDVLVGGGTGTEPVKEISTYVTLDSKHYSQHF
jgi:hypothetical protein